MTTRLLINGEDYCEIFECVIEAPGRHRLILEKPVEVDLLEKRKFRLRLPEGQEINFEPFFDDEEREGFSILGCPRPDGFYDPAREEK